MGEKLRDLSAGKINEKDLIIELNKSSSGNQEDEIHVEFNDMRIEVLKSDFLVLSTAILKAKANLVRIKGIKS